MTSKDSDLINQLLQSQSSVVTDERSDDSLEIKTNAYDTKDDKAKDQSSIISDTIANSEESLELKTNETKDEKAKKQSKPRKSQLVSKSESEETDHSYAIHETVHCTATQSNGVIRYIGSPMNDGKILYGIELYSKSGDCNGTFAGNNIAYFKVSMQRGVFVSKKEIRKGLFTHICINCQQRMTVLCTDEMSERESLAYKNKILKEKYESEKQRRVKANQTVQLCQSLFASQLKAVGLKDLDKLKRSQIKDIQRKVNFNFYFSEINPMKNTQNLNIAQSQRVRSHRRISEWNQRMESESEQSKK